MDIVANSVDSLYPYLQVPNPMCIYEQSTLNTLQINTSGALICDGTVCLSSGIPYSATPVSISTAFPSGKVYYTTMLHPDTGEYFKVLCLV